MADPGKAEGMFVAPITGSAMFQAFCKMFFFGYCPLTVEGRERLPVPPFILCSNHASHIDSAVLMTASGLPFTTFAMLGASDYFFDSRNVKFVVSRFMNVIPINRQARHNSLQRSLAMCGEFLQRTRGNLILYPEGTRSCDGKMQTFKKGVGLFVVELGVPVVPAYIEGSHHSLAKGKLLPRPRRVVVRFGEPLVFESNRSDHLRDRELRKAAVELLEQRIRELSQRTPGDFAGAPAEKRPAITSISVMAKKTRRIS